MATEFSLSGAFKAWAAGVFLWLYRWEKRAMNPVLWVLVIAALLANIAIYFIFIGLGPKAAWAQMIHAGLNLLVWGVLAFGAAAAAGGVGVATPEKGDVRPKAEGTFRFCLGMIVAFTTIMVMGWIGQAHQDFLSFGKLGMLYAVAFGIGFLRKWTSDTPYIVLMRLCLISAVIFSVRLLGPVLWGVLQQNEHGIWKAMAIAFQRIIDVHNKAMVHGVWGPPYFFAFLVLVGAILSRRPIIGSSSKQVEEDGVAVSRGSSGLIGNIVVLGALSVVVIIFTMLNLAGAPLGAGFLPHVSRSSVGGLHAPYGLGAKNLVAGGFLLLGLAGGGWIIYSASNKFWGTIGAFAVLALGFILYQSIGL